MMGARRFERIRRVAALVLTGIIVAQPWNRAMASDGTVSAATKEMERAIALMYPCLVRIDVVMESGTGGRMQKSRGFGSGAIVSKEGYVLTNHHVAGRGTRFLCTLANREEVDGILVGTDVLTDLAVIKLDLESRANPEDPLPVAAFGDSAALKVGDRVYAMGSPAGLSQCVTMGIVANTELILPRHMARGFSLDGERIGELVRWIGHDAVIAGGNSGGPLVNTAGEIVGVNEVGISSIGGAIPSNLAKKIANDLIKQGFVERSWIGVEAQPLLRGMNNHHGVLVACVLPGSPGEAAGILPGDYVTAVNGKPVPDCRADEELPLFNAMVVRHPVGSSLKLEGKRDGKAIEWRVTTALREPAQDREKELVDWGMTARDLTTISAIQKRRDNTDGVLVDTVSSGGACGQADPEIRGGDVIVRVGDKPVTNVAGLVALTGELLDGREKEAGPLPVLVAFERDRKQMLTVAKIGDDEDPDKPRRAEKAWLGVEVQAVDRDLAEKLGLDISRGVRITWVMPESPAEKASLEVGDILTEIDEEPIQVRRASQISAFANMIREYDVGDEAEFATVRDGKELDVTVEFGAEPPSDSELEEYRDELFEMTIRELSAKRKVRADFDLSRDAVEIASVERSGWASLAGLKVGDIILKLDGHDVRTIDETRKQLEQYREDKPRRVVVFVKRGVRSLFCQVEPKW